MPLSAIIAQYTKLEAQRVCPVAHCSRRRNLKWRGYAELERPSQIHMMPRTRFHCTHFGSPTQGQREPCPAIEAFHRGNQEYMKTMMLTNSKLLQNLDAEKLKR